MSPFSAKVHPRESELESQPKIRHFYFLQKIVYCQKKRKKIAYLVKTSWPSTTRPNSFPSHRIQTFTRKYLMGGSRNCRDFRLLQLRRYRILRRWIENWFARSKRGCRRRRYLAMAVKLGFPVLAVQCCVEGFLEACAWVCRGGALKFVWPKTLSKLPKEIVPEFLQKLIGRRIPNL